MDAVSLVEEGWLPAVVIGYRLPGVDGYSSLDPLADFPALHALETPVPTYVFEHQLGGLSCLQVHVAGVALRLEDNLGVMLPGAERLIDALREMGESRWSGRLSREFALLEAWRESHGEEMTEPDLREIESLLRRFVPGLPSLQRGWEALLESVPGPSLHAFAGWRAARLAPEGDVVVVAERLAEQLYPVGRAVGLEAPAPQAPQVFVLWESSD